MTTMNELASAKRFLMEMSGGAEPTPVLAAVSGGLDSMCLLHLLSTWGRTQNIVVTAAHFNHQLRGEESDRDQRFVRDWCAGQDVPFVSGCGDVRTLAEEEGLSIEEAARKARYAFLAEQQRAGGHTFVLTAHHADDNAETMLLNLLRGTGTRGLAGIPDFRGCIARPFLGVTRQELAEYAAAHDIPHVEDSTNQMDDAARNVLRHKVLPVLKELNPRAVENMTRAAELLARDEEALTAMAESLLSKCRLGKDRAELAIEDCRGAGRAVLSRCVWAMMVAVCGHRKDLSFTHVEAVCDLVWSVSGREISLPYGMTARREEQAFVIWKNRQTPQDVFVRVGQKVDFGAWTVDLSPTGGGWGIALPEDAELSVTTWRREDRMTVPGSRGARSLKRLCADRGILPAQRDVLPVFRVNGCAAAVPGIGFDLDVSPQEGMQAVFVSFHQNIGEKTHEK